MLSQLQNCPPAQNRPFEVFWDNHSSPALLGRPPSWLYGQLRCPPKIPSKSSILRKREVLQLALLLLILLILCASCSSGSGNRWIVDHVHASAPAFASSKLTYKDKDPTRGIDLELLHIGETPYLYLIVHSQALPAYNQNPKAAYVCLGLGDKQYDIIAFRHEGGQRLLLPDSIYSLLFDALETGKSVKVKLEGYQSTIDAKNFKEQFKAWKNPPILTNPFRLPF